jgi:hypothetical protein
VRESPADSGAGSGAGSGNGCAHSGPHGKGSSHTLSVESVAFKRYDGTRSYLLWSKAYPAPK